MKRQILFNYETLSHHYLGVTTEPTKEIFSVVDILTSETIFIIVGDLTKFAQTALKNKQAKKFEVLNLLNLGKTEKIYNRTSQISSTETIYVSPSTGSLNTYIEKYPELLL